MQAKQKPFASRHVAETSADARRLSLVELNLESSEAILGQVYAPVCYYTINKYRCGCCRRNHGHLQPAGGIGGRLIAQIARGVSLESIDKVPRSTQPLSASSSWRLVHHRKEIGEFYLHLQSTEINDIFMTYTDGIISHVNL